MKIKAGSLIRIIEIYLMRGVIRVMHLSRLRPKRVIFNSYRGAQYSCNPKCISDYLLDKNEGWEVIWAFNAPDRFKSLESKGIKVVRYYSLRRFFYEATAYASINNVGSFSWIPLRKGQLHINTWHGGGCYKRVALGENKNDDLFKQSLLMNSYETTHYISSSRFFSREIIPTEFGYYGNLLECGMPRNDIFFDAGAVAESNRKVREKYGIGEDKFVVLYAPTWRYDSDYKIPTPDFDRVKETAAKRYGRECEIVLRPHPLSQIEMGSYINAGDYPDMQELLCAADMLITDYSSCIWDYALLGRPCFLFVPDEKEYYRDRGLYMNVREWRIPVAVSDDELEDKIESISDDEMKAMVRSHLDMLGSYEVGKAQEAVYKLLKSGI